jgi:hypothetical protein
MRLALRGYNATDYQPLTDILMQLLHDPFACVHGP